jgi:hypothetical protein
MPQKNVYESEHGPEYQLSKSAKRKLKGEGYKDVSGGHKAYYDQVVNDPRPEAKSMAEYQSGKGLSHYAATYRADMRKRAAKRGTKSQSK